MSKNYLAIVLMALAVFILLIWNPSGLQQKRYHRDGKACPDPAWNALIVLAIGTGAYLFLNKYRCAAM